MKHRRLTVAILFISFFLCAILLYWTDYTLAQRKIDMEAFYEQVNNKIQKEGLSAAIKYIRDSIKVGDYFIEKDANTNVKITDIDLWVEGKEYVIGDGKYPTNPIRAREQYWYNSSGERIMALSLSY